MVSRCLISLLLFTSFLPTLSAQEVMSDANIHARGAFQNARIRFEREKKGHVAFIGGSITEMNGYRPMVMEILKERFPQTEFTFTAAGISSTCSTTGAFRLEKHVLSEGPVDLLFVEFAVNDDQDAAHAHRECIRGMEGVVRHTRLHNPSADIVITYFVNEGMLKTCREGKIPLTSGAHGEVAEFYQVPTIDLAKELADQLNAERTTWEEFGGVHPKPYGNKICTKMVDQLMGRMWANPLPADAAPQAYRLPEQPLDVNSYFRGRLIDPEKAKFGDGVTICVPPGKKLPFSHRAVPDKLLCAETPGAELSLEFEGTAIGAYVRAGPDAGIVEASVDGGAFKTVDLYHRFSGGGHYRRTVMFDADLPAGKHTLQLRVSKAKNEKSKGHAFRALYFVAN